MREPAGLDVGPHVVADLLVLGAQDDFVARFRRSARTAIDRLVRVRSNLAFFSPVPLSFHHSLPVIDVRSLRGF